MPVHPIAVPTEKCAVEDCLDHAVRDACCVLHAVENDAAQLAVFVLEQLEQRSGSLEHATRASRALLERLTVLAACRDAIARAAVAPNVEVGL